MRIRFAVEVDVEGSLVALRSPSALGLIAGGAVEQALADAGLEPIAARVRSQQLPEPVAIACAHCGGPMPPPRRRGGRQRRFCSDAHRMAALRRRAQGLPEELGRPAGARGRRSLAGALEHD